MNTAGSSTATELHNNANETVIPLSSAVALGTNVHDKATVSEANAAFDPTGDVTFTFFTSTACTGPGADKGAVALNGSGVAHPSQASGSLAAGDYSFRAHYNGDTNFDASTSDCEPFHVNKAGSSTATELHNNANETVIPLSSAVALGTNVHDKATVTEANAAFDPTGDVTFTFFANNTCDGAGTGKGTVALAAGVAHPSQAGALPAGDYAFRAHYNGDTNFDASTSDCEPFHVSTAASSTATELHNNANETVIPLSSAAALGTNVHDKATVSEANAAFDPTGDVTFTFFTNNTCDGAGTGKGTVALAAGVAHPSDASGALAAGDYAFRAHYNGDSNFDASTSDCEPFHVNKAGSSTATELHNNANETVIPLSSAVALGTNVHDKATVSEANAALDPTGNVNFTFFANNTCTGPGTDKGTVALAAGVAHPSQASGALPAGDYAFRAHYNGDTNFDASTSDCEPFHVNKAGSSTATELHNNANETVIPFSSAVALGTNAHDKATVSEANAAFDPTADVTFTFFTNNTCDGAGTDKGTVALAAGVAHPSQASGALPAGDYAFRAHYNGDSNFDASTSDCEPFHVNKAGSSTATELHNNANETVIALNSLVDLGTNVHDKATVSEANAAFDPTGDVTFTFFTNNACTGPGADKGTVALNGSGVAHPSQASGALPAGNYAFRAHYNGDDNFDASTSDCEPFHVNKAGSSTATELHNNAGEAVIPLSTSVPLGTNVHDKATVSEANAAFDPTGDVTFTFFADNTCDGAGAGKGTVSLVSGVAHPSQASGALDHWGLCVPSPLQRRHELRRLDQRL